MALSETEKVVNSKGVRERFRTPQTFSNAAKMTGTSSA
jgi:hypothetical protein